MKNILLSLVLISIVTTTNAQFRLPSLELQVKGGYTFYEGTQFIPDVYDPGTTADLRVLYTAISGGLEGYVNITPNFSVGLFYNRSISGSYGYDDYDSGSGGADKPVKHLIYGAKFRASLGRVVRFRPHIHASYYHREMVAEFETMTISHENNGLAAGLGMMIKINDRLYVTIPEFTIFFSDDRPIFIDNTPDGQGSMQGLVEAGISYYIHNKR